MVFLIRIIEMYVISVIPSAVSVWLALNKLRALMAWRYACTISFLLSLAVHIWCWRREVILTQNDKSVFYKVNLTAFAGYSVMIPVLLNFSDKEVFSAVYAALRGFEIFGLPTVLSAIISLAIMFVAMLLTKRVVGKKVDFMIEMSRRENEEEV